MKRLQKVVALVMLIVVIPLASFANEITEEDTSIVRNPDRGFYKLIQVELQQGDEDFTRFEKQIISVENEYPDISIISLILGLITIGLIFIIVRKATNPIDDLKDGFSNLLNSNDSNINLNIKSNDEIGDVAKLFNAYMDKVRDGLKQDEKVIEEVSNIIEKTSNGFFVYNVNSKAANPHVEEDRKSVV